MSSLTLPEDTPQNLGDWLTFAERLFDTASHAFERADLILSSVEDFGARLSDDPDALLLGESDTSSELRRIERLKRRRAEILSRRSHHDANNYITVKQLADEIGQTDGATRRLLERGLIPGARRKTPGVKNSPWIIPASASETYLAQHSNGKEK
jgi:hypothetical protein